MGYLNIKQIGSDKVYQLSDSNNLTLLISAAYTVSYYHSLVCWVVF